MLKRLCLSRSCDAIGDTRRHQRRSHQGHPAPCTAQCPSLPVLLLSSPARDIHTCLSALPGTTRPQLTWFHLQHPPPEACLLSPHLAGSGTAAPWRAHTLHRVDTGAWAAQPAGLYLSLPAHVYVANRSLWAVVAQTITSAHINHSERAKEHLLREKSSKVWHVL